MWVFILIIGLPLLAWGLITVSHRQQSEADWAAEARREAAQQADIKEKQAAGVACCPYCGSTALSANRRGYKLARGVFWGVILGGFGGWAVGLVGLAIGLALGLSFGSVGAGQVIVTCLSCGRTHRAGAKQ